MQSFNAKVALVCRNTRYCDRMDYGVQIQLRFCVVDASTKQPDCFPASIGVKVNNMMAQLPVTNLHSSIIQCKFVKVIVISMSPNHIIRKLLKGYYFQ